MLVFIKLIVKQSHNATKLQTHFNDVSPTSASVPFNSSKSAINSTLEPAIAGVFDFTRNKYSREYATALQIDK